MKVLVKKFCKPCVLLVQELQHETVQVTVDERKISNTSTISAVGGPQQSIVSSSVADPDSSDPYVFGPPGSGSGSISQRYESGPGAGSGSGSIYHQA